MAMFVHRNATDGILLDESEVPSAELHASLLCNVCCFLPKDLLEGDFLVLGQVKSRELLEPGIDGPKVVAATGIVEASGRR